MKRWLPQFRETRWLVVVSVAWVWLIGPGSIEGRIWPAASPMILTAMAQTDGETEVWGKSARLRPECSFRMVKWYVGDRFGKNVPARVSLGPSMVRDDGPFEFGPWVVNIWPKERVRDYSFADVLHQCWLGPVKLPWLTRTRFWN